MTCREQLLRETKLWICMLPICLAGWMIADIWYDVSYLGAFLGFCIVMGVNFLAVFVAFLFARWKWGRSVRW